jgi:hypothetical protein
MVLHLRSAACGAEEFYTTENNTVRTETVDQARDMDAKVMDVWTGHPHHKIVGNANVFQGKILNF